jgi:hypothetical protein
MASFVVIRYLQQHMIHQAGDLHKVNYIITIGWCL